MANSIRIAPLLRAAASALLLLGASCALVDREVVLDYDVPPRTEAATGKSAVEASLTPPPTIAVREVVDRRVDPKHVGEVRNGFGMHTADIHHDGNASQWVRKALTTELQRAGFTTTTEPSQASIVIDAEILAVHCTAMMTYEGDLSITASAWRNGAQLLGRRYDGKAGAGLNWTATEHAFAESLDLALQDALIQFTKELRAALGAAAGSPD